MKDVSIALLGSGFVGDFYMQGLANVPGQQVAVNYSRDTKRAKAFARRWSIPESSTDLGKLIARSDIDLYSTQPLADSITWPVTTPTQKRLDPL